MNSILLALKSELQFKLLIDKFNIFLSSDFDFGSSSFLFFLSPFASFPLPLPPAAPSPVDGPAFAGWCVVVASVVVELFVCRLFPFDNTFVIYLLDPEQDGIGSPFSSNCVSLSSFHVVSSVFPPG